MGQQFAQTVLEDIFKELLWKNKGIKIDGIRLNHLRFVNYIIIITSNKEELQDKLTKLNKISKAMRLKIKAAQRSLPFIGLQWRCLKN